MRTHSDGSECNFPGCTLIHFEEGLSPFDAILSDHYHAFLSSFETALKLAERTQNDPERSVEGSRSEADAI